VTSLVWAAGLGDATIDVKSTVGFKVGDEIVIDAGHRSEESAHVLGFGSLRMVLPLQNLHHIGASVQVKATCALFARYYACAKYHHSLEKIPCQHFGPNALSCEPEDADYCCSVTLDGQKTEGPGVWVKAPAYAPPEEAFQKRLFNGKGATQSQAHFGRAGVFLGFVCLAGLFWGVWYNNRSCRSDALDSDYRSYTAMRRCNALPMELEMAVHVDVTEHDMYEGAE